MKNHLASDNNWSTVNLHPPPQKKYKKYKIQGMTNDVVLTFSVGDTIACLQLVLS